MPLRVQMKCLTFGMLQLSSNDFSAIKLQYTSHDGALILAFVSTYNFRIVFFQRIAWDEKLTLLEYVGREKQKIHSC
jgi:hypothetical protein